MTASCNGEIVLQGYLAGIRPEGIQVITAGSVVEETSLALKQVIDWLDEGVPANQIAIVVRRENLYLQPLADRAAEYGVPLISGQQLLFVGTPLGGLLQAVIAAIFRSWPYEATQAVLTSPLLQLPFDAVQRAIALRDQRPDGIATWDTSLAYLELPAVTSRREVLGALEQLFHQGQLWELARTEPVLNVALNVMVRHVRPYAQDDSPCSLGEALAILSHLLWNVELPALLGKSAVRVLNPIGAVGRSFRRLIVLGLADGIFPVHRSDDPLIDSFVRERWRNSGIAMPDQAELCSVEEALFLLSISTATEELVLMRPTHDLQTHSLTVSPFLEVMGCDS